MNARLCERWQQLLRSSFSPGAGFTSGCVTAATRRWCDTQHFVRQMSGRESSDDDDEELSEFLGMQ